MADIIMMLLERPFSQRTLSEKREIIDKGRPTPELRLLTSNLKRCKRHFNSNSYKKKEWLCGSIGLCRLFCWPCLLFSNEKGPWNSVGFVDLNNLFTAVKRHEKSLNHMTFCSCLIRFGSGRIETALSQLTQIHISAHNEKVRRNRDILKRLINAVCFLAQQELAFRGDESSASVNRRNYLELLEYTSQYDTALLALLESSSLFKGVSNRILNDLIEALATTLTSFIKKELNSAKFVSVIADETTDISTQSQLAIVLRYCLNGNIHERFLKYVDVSGNKQAHAISEIIVNEINSIGVGDKLVGQSYDGAAVISSELNGVQALVKEAFGDRVFFVHSYTHNLNLVLSDAMKNISHCKRFFSDLNGLSAFLSRSVKRSKVLDDVLSINLPSVCVTRWSYSSRLVNDINGYLPQLRDVLETILEHDDEFNGETITAAGGYISWLYDFLSCFLLKVFSEIYGFTDVLFSCLQKRSLDVLKCQKLVKEVEREVQSLRSDEKFDLLWNNVESDVGPPAIRRDNKEYSENPRMHLKRLYFEIIDTICHQIQVRFKDYNHIHFLGLVDPEHFDTYNKKFPQTIFDQLMETYPFFDRVTLKTELKFLYSTENIHAREPSKVYAELMNSDLGFNKVVPELTVLYTLICTIPVTTASVKRSFPCLKRIKTYSRNRLSQKKLSNLALLSIENGLFKNLKDKETFFNEVVEHFSQQDDRRMEFRFK